MPQIQQQEEPVIEKRQSDEVDGGYGWICVMWGKALDYAFIGGLSISQITFIAPVVTKFNRKFGTRATLLTGAILEAAALIAASFATRVWHLYLAQGVLFGWGSGFQYIGASGIIPQWFKRRQVFANSIASAGSGLGGLIWTLAAQAMITNLGLSWSYRITAICAFTVNVICALLMRDRNSSIKPNQRAFDLQLLRNYGFVLLLIWGYFSMLGYTILLFSLPSYATNIGLSSQQAAIVGAMVNLGMAAGRPVVGFYSDRIGSVNMAGGATFFGSLICFLVWMFAESYGLLVLTALLGGSVCGTFWATIAPLTSQVIGLKELPSGLSIIWTLVVIPCLFAEPIAISLQGHATNSKSVQIFTGAMFLAGAISLLFLRYWKVKRLVNITSNESRNLHSSLENELKKGALAIDGRLVQFFQNTFILPTTIPEMAYKEGSQGASSAAAIFEMACKQILSLKLGDRPGARSANSCVAIIPTGSTNKLSENKQLEDMAGPDESREASARMLFIVSSNIEKADPATRKLIRSHVLRGEKKKGASMFPGRVGSDLSFDFRDEIELAMLLNTTHDDMHTVAVRIIFPLKKAIGFQPDDKEIVYPSCFDVTTIFAAEGFIDKIPRRQENRINPAAM
ncbi:hypothetical protein B7494_g2188 [Chlorociboria aeruginascens]|nr:hypothetical protein B7494_g2188 [Chlorociboria aeruginascens]